MQERKKKRKTTKNKAKQPKIKGKECTHMKHIQLLKTINAIIIIIIIIQEKINVAFSPK